MIKSIQSFSQFSELGRGDVQDQPATDAFAVLFANLAPLNPTVLSTTNSQSMPDASTSANTAAWQHLTQAMQAHVQEATVPHGTSAQQPVTPALNSAVQSKTDAVLTTKAETVSNKPNAPQAQIVPNADLKAAQPKAPVPSLTNTAPTAPTTAPDVRTATPINNAAAQPTIAIPATTTPATTVAPATAVPATVTTKAVASAPAPKSMDNRPVLSTPLNPVPTTAVQVMMVDTPAAVVNAAPQPASAALTANVGTQAWQQQLQQNMVQMVKHHEQQLTLRLHPAELGPLQMQLQMDEKGAQLNILTHSSPVRQAIEQALPHLREALANQGIQLSGSNVSDQDQSFTNHQQQQQQSNQPLPQFLSENTPENLESADNLNRENDSRTAAAPARGQVDLYA